MGKIISPPKIPSIPAAPVKPAVTNPQAETEEEAAARVRRADLLQRERGTFGTVQTGFRGILGLTSQGQPRKTLLGE